MKKIISEKYNNECNSLDYYLMFDKFYANRVFLFKWLYNNNSVSNIRGKIYDQVKERSKFNESDV